MSIASRQFYCRCNLNEFSGYCANMLVVCYIVVVVVGRFPESKGGLLSGGRFSPMTDTLMMGTILTPLNWVEDPCPMMDTFQDDCEDF